MNLSTIFKVGSTFTNNYLVKPEDTADFIGNTGVTMLSTPAMIKFMEETASYIIINNMPENCRPVGTKIEVEHINPTPIDMKVIVKATLTAIKGKKLCYNIEAFNEQRKIGFGVYEQCIINLENFLDKHKFEK